MRNLYAIATVLLLNIFNVHAQAQSAAGALHGARAEMISREMNGYTSPNGFSLSTTGINYDVKYHRLELRLQPDTTVSYVKGKVTTYYKNLTANFNKIQFDLASELTCDSVYYHGARLNTGSISRAGNVLSCDIPTVALVGTLDSISIFYQGSPPVLTDLGSVLGFRQMSHGTPARKYIYTVSESYSAYTWWPCKSMITSDKADSLDMIISTPDSFRVASNGTLMSETISGGNKITYWKHRYPISTYQVAVGVANYQQYPAAPTMVNVNGTMMPYYNWIFPEDLTNTAKTNLDKAPAMITAFSSKFGDYPFKNEKYGHYTMGPNVGGMEHNTFSGMSTYTYGNAGAWDVIAHELGHQWFGASVTCKSWGELWINESFATFSEIICAEFAPSSSGSTANAWRTTMKTNVMKSTNQARPIYSTDTSSTGTLFGQSIYVYERGAMVINMLRTLLGDTKFFQAMQNYQADPVLKYGSAGTPDVQRHMENVSGLDLSSFFSNWIYNKGVASYSGAQWNSSGKNIVLKLPQTVLYNAGMSHFDMPVTVRIQANGGTPDTTIIAYDKGGVLYYDIDGTLVNAGGNMLYYNLSFLPKTITFDQLDNVLSDGTFTKNTSLGVLDVDVVNFTASKSGFDALLNWSMSNTTDQARYEIERSKDGRNFVKIGEVNGADYPQQDHFTYRDINITGPADYYRIKITPQNGAVKYTETIVINSRPLTGNITVAPNPASEYIDVRLQPGKDNMVFFNFYDANGRLMRSETRTVTASTQTLRLPLTGFAKGIYHLEVLTVSGKLGNQQVVVN